jgi:SAM-dependent methyltransferase
LKSTLENLDIFFGSGKGKTFFHMRRDVLVKWLGIYIPRSGKALDLGCWKGDFLTLLPSTWEKCGVDFQHHPELPLDVQFVPANLEVDFPQFEDQFDLIFAGEIIEHICATQKLLERCFNILKSKGLLILTTPNTSCWLNLWRWLSLGQLYSINSDEGQDGHVRYFAPTTLKVALKKAGFNLIKITTSGGLEFLKIIPWVHSLIFKIFNMRGKNILVLAQKP